MNDRQLCESTINIPILSSRISQAIREGKVLEAIQLAEELRNHSNNLCWRLKDIANIVREPMGG